MRNLIQTIELCLQWYRHGAPYMFKLFESADFKFSSKGLRTYLFLSPQNNG